MDFIFSEPLISISLCLCLVFIIVGAVLLIQGGLFYSIDVATRSSGIGQTEIAYKFATGSFESSGPLFTDVHSILPNNRTIGVYYHPLNKDPKKTNKSEMRHIVGVILNDPGKEVSANHREQLANFGFNFTSFPAIGNSVQTSFPFKNTLSIILSVHRIYPALTRYMTSKNLCGHPVMEIYDNDKQSIFFIVPLEAQDKFYVPEARYLLDYRQVSSDDDNSTVSFDDSCSFIRSEEGDVDSITGDSSVNQDSITAFSDQSLNEEAAGEICSGAKLEDSCKPPERKISQSELSDESEGTDSSYEKIDSTEAVQS